MMPMKVNFNSKIPIAAIILLIGRLRSLDAQEPILFEYKHNTGDRWHLSSIVKEEVLLNKQMLYKTEILNKISVEVRRGDGQDGYLWNRHEIAEKKDGSQVYAWSNSLEVEYYRDRRGRISGLPKESLVPTVRNVPVYPLKPVLPGEKWAERGTEVFNLEPTYGIDERIVIHFVADYNYWGRETRSGKQLDLILINYSYNWKPDILARKRLSQYSTHPVKIDGKFHQELFWDPEAGRNYAEEGEFSYTYTMNNGQVFTFRGITRGQAVYPKLLNKENLLREIEDLNDDGIDAEIREEGVSLSLDNIQFHPDSAEMLPGEENKLDNILKLLSRYAERDIMVIGHTARVQERGKGQVLSEQRARVVADIILEKGAKLPEQLIIRGMGSSKPIGDNSTERGRRKNRRVEIIILEN